MPKKKLTKAQVKHSLAVTGNNMYNLILDKMGYPDSKVPISLPKLMEFHKLLQSASKRIK